MGKEEYEDCETSDETSDSPAHTSATVRVNIGLANVLGETGVLLRQGLFKLGQDSLLVV